MSALLLPNEILSMSAQAARLLVESGDGDGALLYLALLERGGDPAGAAAALRAGNDLMMPGSGGDRRDILQALRSGMLTEEELRRCCGNVIRAILDSAVQREYINDYQS